MIDKSKKLFDKIFFGLGAKSQVLRYLVGGGSAFLVDLGALYLFKGVIGFSLMPSVALAFLCGFTLSFVAQKYWTFNDHSYDRIHKQAGAHFGVTTLSFFTNLLLMHILVTVLGMWYILAKIIVSGLIAVAGFFVYKHFIFKKQPVPNDIVQN